MKHLNTRQWVLYNFLKEQDAWITQFEIAQELQQFYFCDDRNRFHDSQARKTMTADIRTINDCPKIQKIVLSTPRGVKIATEEEFDKYIGKEISNAVKRLERAKNKAIKGNRGGQLKITFGAYERNIIEAFLKN
ncbi:MAG: hypothetical protein IKW45_06525 [Clostridia bacterium]|nr:hypothetical protein [Clostridia bacterium]